MKTCTKFLAGAVTILALAMIGCQNDTDTHEHTYSADWKSDETSHWHPATCEHTSEVSEKTAHTFGEAVVTKEATETETGIKTYTCTICKYEKTESIAVLPHTHKYSTEWTSDETNHWHAATCGHDVKSGEEKHSFDEGKVTKAATKTDVDKKTYTCTVCNYQRSVAVGDIIYTDGTTSSKDAELTSGKTPVAVVAGFNPNGVMFGLGLKQSSSSLQWAPRDTTGYKTNFTEIIAYSDNTGTGAGSTATIKGDTDGSDNWEYVKSRDPKGTANAATNYPAFNFAATYATTAGITGEIAEGWYMPSIAELCELYKNKDTLNTSLSKCSGTQFTESYYWSSSQTNYDYNAWYLDFSDGDLRNYDKSNNFYVCCVRAF